MIKEKRNADGVADVDWMLHDAMLITKSKPVWKQCIHWNSGSEKGQYKKYYGHDVFEYFQMVKRLLL